jgi:hypothetical protein
MTAEWSQRRCARCGSPLANMIAIGWFPVKRSNPRSTLRGLLAVELASGLIIYDISVLSTGRSHWVQPAGRLKLDPVTNQPVDGPYRWEPTIEFRDPETRRRFSNECIAALLRLDQRALDEVQPVLPD